MVEVNSMNVEESVVQNDNIPLANTILDIDDSLEREIADVTPSIGANYPYIRRGTRGWFDPIVPPELDGRLV